MFVGLLNRAFDHRGFDRNPVFYRKSNIFIVEFVSLFIYVPLNKMADRNVYLRV